MVGVLLFAQLAVSGFACQGGGFSPVALQASDPGAVVADTHCGDAGVDTPNLCFEHCRDGASTPGQASSVPDFGLALTGGLPLLLYDPVQPLGHFAPARFGIEPGTPPPHAILHCCLRT